VSASRPWWASDGPVDGGVDPAEDPLLAHRTARRGDGNTEPTDGSGRAQAADPEAEPAPAPPHAGSEICGVCPVCIAARMLGESRPELLAHLTEAGRHLSAALRTLREPPTDRSGDEAGPGDRGVRRIDLD
jgi:hypothetical protein